MPYNTSPSVRNKPVAFTSFLTLALAAAVVAGALLSGVTSGAAQDRMRPPGFGRNDAILAEQRRHAQALERIELAIGRLRADIALVNARIEGAGTLNREAANAAPVNWASGNPARNNPGRGKPPLSGPEFDLGALRASFEPEAVMPGARAAFRPHLRRAAKGGPAV